MQTEKDPKFEKNEGKEFIKRSLDLAKSKRVERERKTPAEMVQEALSGKPEAIQEMVQGDYDRLRAKISDENDLREEVDINSERITTSYYDSKLEMPNGSLSKLHAVNKIDELLEGESTVEDLKRMARISFDLNGLKPVNDLNSGDHSKGDQYLELARDTINDTLASKEAKKFINDHGLNIDTLLSRDGGDEFGLVITSDKPMDQGFLDGLTDMMKDNLWKSEKAGEILDFSREDILLNFLGIEEADFKKFYDGDLNKVKKDFGIPEDFKYRAAFSGKGSTLYEALNDEENDKVRKLSEEDDIVKIKQAFMGAMFSTSDRGMDEDKKRFKKQLAEKEFGTPEYAMTQVYSRNERERELNRENEELKKQTRSLTTTIEAIREERGGGNCPHCGRSLIG
ncbi:hypothetical protein GF382_03590 [Candidatus Falkowbacteria bacterium]|nr:hypothetical protein [Candidatus Falkowbacteria bacterium]